MITKAACRAINGKVYSLPRPARHHDVLRDMWINGEKESAKAEQGFMDDNEGFVSRERALQIVKECGQPVSNYWKRNPHNMLFSEDLW